MDDEDIDLFIQRLSRPLFVYRMSKGMAEDETRPVDSRIRKSAITKLRNSREEIKKVVESYGQTTSS